MAIRYTIDTENKVIELQNNGSMEELRDLYELYKDYTFSIAFSSPKLEKQGMIVGAKFVPIIGDKNYN